MIVRLSIDVYRDVISPIIFDQFSILSELRCFKAQLAKTSWMHHADIHDDKDSLLMSSSTFWKPMSFTLDLAIVAKSGVRSSSLI